MHVGSNYRVMFAMINKDIDGSSGEGNVWIYGNCGHTEHKCVYRTCGHTEIAQTQERKCGYTVHEEKCGYTEYKEKCGSERSKAGTQFTTRNVYIANLRRNAARTQITTRSVDLQNRQESVDERHADANTHFYTRR